MKPVFRIFFAIPLFLLASCGQPEDSTKDFGTGQTDIQVATPQYLENNAPSIAKTLGSIGEGLQNEPLYRACIARSTQMCGSELIVHYSQIKESDDACEVFENENLKSACITGINIELARKNSDISFCDRVADSEKGRCIGQAKIAKAVASKDFRLCMDLQEISSTGAQIIPASMDVSSQCITQVLFSLDANETAKNPCTVIASSEHRDYCSTMLKSRIEMQKTLPQPPIVEPSEQ